MSKNFKPRSEAKNRHTICIIAKDTNDSPPTYANEGIFNLNELVKNILFLMKIPKED